MSGEHFYGRMTTCKECGGKTVPTGKIGSGRSRRPSINSSVSRHVRLVEHKCEFCGFEDWSEDGTSHDWP
jgi:hypothetical protein